MFITATFHWTAGFVDFFLSLKIPLANHPYMLIVQGLVFADICYFLFRFLIVKFNLKTPGREDDADIEDKAGETNTQQEINFQVWHLNL